MVARSPALRRRRLAATIGVAWLLAVLILPALHLGHHDHAHEHRADGTIVTVTVTVTSDDHDHGPGAAPHRHDDLADEFSEEDAADHGAPPQREPDRPAVSAPHLDHAAAATSSRSGCPRSGAARRSTVTPG